MMKIWSENPQHKISYKIIFNMSASEVCFLVSVLLALAAQAINLAAASLEVIIMNDIANVKDRKDVEQVYGSRIQLYIILSGASISALILFYFIIDYFTRCRTSHGLNIVFLCIVVSFQMTIGVIWSLYLVYFYSPYVNAMNKLQKPISSFYYRSYYDSVYSSYYSQYYSSYHLQFFLLSQQSIDILKRFVIFYRLMIAATALTFALGVVGLLIGFYSRTISPWWKRQETFYPQNVIYMPGTAQNLAPMQIHM